MFTKVLYQSVESIWEKYYSHPFLKEMQKGILPKEKFKHYLIQDYLYLLDYAKVFALGVVKSKCERDMKRFSQLINGILSSEMGIHKIYMKKLDIDYTQIENNYKRKLKNTSYTNYMLSVSFLGDLKEICVATLACMWSYEKIAETLYNEGIENDNFYKEWFEAYQGNEYDELNSWVLNLVDELTINCSEDEKERLIEIFQNCSLYELEFWDMGYNI